MTLIKRSQHNKLLKKYFLFTILFGFVIFSLNILGAYPQLINKYYTNTLYKDISIIIHPITLLIPFSIGDFLYTLIIGLIVYTIICISKVMIKRNYFELKTLILKGILGVQIFVSLFYLLWGLNYSRPPAGELLGLRNITFSTSELKDVTASLIDSVNASRKLLTQADLSQSNKSIYIAATKAIQTLSNNYGDFKTYNPGVKSSILTPLLNYLGTAGYFNPFTGEAQINGDMPVFNRPVVACHEMSHQMGFGAEDEANFVGFLAGIGSHDHLLHYSAYQLAVEECMYALWQKDSLINKDLKKRINKEVHNDFIVERKYWIKYQGRINKISGNFYNNFLKANKQPNGLKTYNNMVILIMAMYKTKNHFNKIQMD